MKITFVLPGYCDRPIGGYKVVYEYANCLVQSGHEATIAYLEDPRWYSSQRFPSALFSRLERRGAQRAYARSPPAISWYPLHEDVTLLRTVGLDARRIPNADAIFATAWYTASSVNECPRPKGAKFYLVMDFPPWLGDKDTLERTWHLPLKKVCISRWQAQLVTQAGVHKEDVAAIPIAVDHTRFHVLRGLRERQKRVAMLYSPLPYKRSQLGLSVLSRCKALVPDLTASLFGPPDQHLVAPPSWVEHHGLVSDAELSHLYNTASIYVCSSAAEGFALPPAEAMACGCAVATTDCGGNREYAEHEKTALVSAPGDDASLTDNVLRLLSDDELRVKLARAGRDRIADFTWEASTRHLLAFIHRST